MNLFLEVFLYFDVFILGAVFTIAVRHAYAHFRPRREEKPHQSPMHAEPSLSRAARDQLVAEAAERYHKILEKSAQELTGELDLTTEKINQSVNKVVDDLIKKEAAIFDQLFKQHEQQANDGFAVVKDQTAAYQAELKAKLNQEAEQEKAKLIQTIDNKLADAVMSFLTESMQHEVDLGAQSDYLIKLLEKHKDEFKQALNT